VTRCLAFTSAAALALLCRLRATIAGIWVPIRPICEYLGIAADSQRRKLLEKGWATTTIIVAVAEDGKNRELFCLSLDSLPTWLATIERPKLPLA
jgi:hypothetical protein